MKRITTRIFAGLLAAGLLTLTACSNLRRQLFRRGHFQRERCLRRIGLHRHRFGRVGGGGGSALPDQGPR